MTVKAKKMSNEHLGGQPVCFHRCSTFYWKYWPEPSGKKNKKERKKWTLFTGGMVPYVENAEGFTK